MVNIYLKVSYAKDYSYWLLIKEEEVIDFGKHKTGKRVKYDLAMEGQALFAASKYIKDNLLGQKVNLRINDSRLTDRAINFYGLLLGEKLVGKIPNYPCWRGYAKNKERAPFEVRNGDNKSFFTINEVNKQISLAEKADKERIEINKAGMNREQLEEWERVRALERFKKLI